jgi:hypothetical protein
MPLNSKESLLGLLGIIQRLTLKVLQLFNLDLREK